MTVNRPDEDFHCDMLEQPSFPKPLSPPTCCGNKTLVCFSVILILISIMASLTALTLSVSSYSNERNQINQLEVEIQLIQAAMLKDKEQLVDPHSDVNGTLSMLSSQVSELQSVLVSQVSLNEAFSMQMSNVEMDINQTNATQITTQLHLNAVNTSATLAMADLSSSLQSLNVEVESKFSLLDLALNSTINITDTLLVSLSSAQEVKHVIASKLSSLEMQVNLTKTSADLCRDQLSALQVEHQEKRVLFSDHLNTSMIAINELTLQVPVLQEALVLTNSRLTTATENIASLEHYKTVTRHALNVTSGNLSALVARIGILSSEISRLNSSLTSPLNIYGGCYRDEINCSVRPLSRNSYWYRCTTAPLRISVEVSKRLFGNLDTPINRIYKAIFSLLTLVYDLLVWLNIPYRMAASIIANFHSYQGTPPPP
jgi:hypothetical protein